MKNGSLFLKLFVFIGLSILLCACNKSTDKSQLPVPVIEAGTAKLSGKIAGYKTDSITYTLTIPQPITSDLFRQELKIESDGSFSIEVPIEINPAIGFLYDFNLNKGFTISLEANKETKIIIDNDSISVVSGPDFYTESSKRMQGAMIKAAQLGAKYELLNKELFDSCIENPKRYIPINEYDLEKRLDIFHKDSLLSKQSKIYLTYYLKSLQIATPLQFKESMDMVFMNIREKGDTTTLKVKEPDLSYYTFMKEYDLGNPYYLYSEVYGGIFQTIFRNETFNIPEIKEIPVKEWISGVKQTMTNLVGTDTGLFYDMAIAQSYMRQLSYQMKPLSDKQIQNIKDYFGDAGIAKVILRKNEDVAKIAASKGLSILNVTPEAPKDKLLEAIINKYKGKVVLVDFWATWCGPCLNAMKEMIPLKQELKEKGIIFVYITNTSSPLKLWEERANGIDGEHYYLSAEEWDYISDNLDIEGIPAYLLYDKSGVMKYKTIGYPGTEEFKKKIEELL